MPIDAETILKRATPLAHQHAHELQPFDHLVRMPIALSEITWYKDDAIRLITSGRRSLLA